MVVDYKSRKNEVLASYDTVEALVAELQAYAIKIGLPDPTERLQNLLKDIRGKAEKVKCILRRPTAAGAVANGS